MAKPETTYKAGIHPFLPTDVHREGMANPYRGGTPDNYYDGPKSDLWIEYKYVTKFPRVLDLLKPTTKPHLTPLQQLWLDRRYDNGGNAAVIIGSREGGLILINKGWNTLICREEAFQELKTKKEVAAWITGFVLHH